MLFFLAILVLYIPAVVFHPTKFLNKQNIPKRGKKCIFAGNHYSYWDPIIYDAKLLRKFRILSKMELFKNQYDTAQKQYEQTAYKDISSAYANYLNNQLSLRAAEGLSLQRQDLLNKANESEFSSAYDKTMGDYASTMANVAENISDTQSKQEELLNKRGKYLRDRMADLVVMAYNNSYDENGNPIYQDLFDVAEDLENEKTIVG